MAKGVSRIVLGLSLFVATVLSLVFGSLYLESRYKLALLKDEVHRLQQSQVLLMVPDEQAAVIADWLEQHPKQTHALIDMFSQTPVKETSNDHKPVKVRDISRTPEKNSVIVSETEDGVKVIKLPHGGIRVTTREDSQTKGNQ